jgi:abhydrolase domain-containing protein 6
MLNAMTLHTKRLFIIVPLLLALMVVAFYHLFPGVVFKVLRNVERRVAGIEQRSLDMGTLHMEYLAGGQGEVLVLLHGFGGDKDNWTRVAKYLTPHFRVVMPDLPGFGDSTKDPDAHYTIFTQVDRLHAFLTDLGISKFHLGGNSMGGYIAGFYAAKFPREIQTLWLLAPGGVISAQPSEFHLLLSKEANPLLVKKAEDYEHLMDFVFFKRPFIPQSIIQHFTRKAIANQPLHSRIFKQLASDTDNIPMELFLPQVRVPTLVTWGEKDRMLHVSGAKILESSLPDATIQIMKNTGHIPMLEKPEASALAFTAFRDQVSD